MFISLHQIHREIAKNIHEKNLTSALNHFQECQEAAIAIGTFIEQLEGEGTDTVIYLEQYCENIYLCTMKMKKENSLKQCDINLLEQYLIDIENVFSAEAAVDKIEIVFLPYKSSMWDSFESIWMAAKEDERCICKVVPIPYYNKNADGTLGEMCYEGEQYPDYVPVLDWKNYDIVSQKPDVAYIHNPYDNMNYVTSVHPFFYAKELKKHVRKLIYCPYFVLEGEVTENFCLVPGVLWADKVFLQSEKIREQYVEYYNAAMNNTNMIELWGSAEEKFVALGSPKIDKVLSYNLQQPLPEEWKVLITGKKVVLYNTHLADSLQFGKMFFDKLRSVLKYFKECKEYALWWRPHPLEEQTITVMRPELLREYQAIVDEYMQEKYGIYDDTSDLNRALRYADFYYGSGSSLVPLFGILGKPVIMQNIYCQPSKMDNVSCAFSINNDVLYIVIEKLAVLASYNIITENWRIESELPLDPQIDVPLYSQMFIKNDILYLFPQNANHIFVYNLKNKEIKIINLTLQANMEQCNFMKFAGILFMDNCCILLPHNYQAILVYYFETEKLLYYTDWIMQIYNWLPDYKPGSFFFRLHSLCSVGNLIFAVLCTQTNDVICCFAKEDMKLIKIYDQFPGGTFQCMETDGSNIWMIFNSSEEIFKWNFRTNEIIRYSRFPKSENTEDNILQYRIILVNNKISIWPRKDNYTFYIDNESNNICKFGSEKSTYYMDLPQLIDKKIYAVNREKEILEIWNSDLEMQLSVSLKLPEEWDISKFLYRIFITQYNLLMNESDNKNIQERMNLQIGDILEAFKYINFDASGTTKLKYESLFKIDKESAGCQIHQYVMNWVEGSLFNS